MKGHSDLLGNYKSIKTANGNSYIVCEVDEVTRVVRLPSKELREIIAFKAAKKGLKSLKQVVNKSIEELEAKSVLVQTTAEVNIRYAMRDNAIYIYLGDDDYLTKISKEGVKRTRNKSVMYVHSKHRGKLAYKNDGKGNFKNFMKLFWRYVPVRNEEDQLILLTYLLDCCFPDTDYQILLITGGSGSGKTFTTYSIRCLLDPSTFGIGCLLKSTKDIYLAAAHNHLLTFDNNGSSLDSDVQNLFCQNCTGGNYIEREFYTNNEPLIVDLKNPVIINGLQSPFTQDDVLNRVIHIQLPQLTPADYAKTGGNKNWQNRFEADLPEIVSGFHDLLQKILVLRDKVEIPVELPRMGDFAKVGIALEQVLKLEKGSFLRAYENNLNYGSSTILEDSELAQAVISLAKSLKEATTYTRIGLIQVLKNYTHSPTAIPDKSRAFRTELDRIEKALFKLRGIKIEHIVRTRVGAKVIITPPPKKSKSK